MILGDMSGGGIGFFILIIFLVVYLFYFFLFKTVFTFICQLFGGCREVDTTPSDETISFEIRDKPQSRVMEVSDEDVEVESSYDSDMNVLTLILKDTVNNRETQPFSIKLGVLEDNQNEIIKTVNDGNIEVIQTKTGDGGFELDINIKDTDKLPFED